MDFAHIPGFTLTVKEDIGLRSYMEDRYDVRHVNNLIMCTVCDGHGGYQCADYVIKNFPFLVSQLLQDPKCKPSTALNNGLKQVIKKWDKLCFKKTPPTDAKQRDIFFRSIDANSYEDNGYTSGTTLLSCIIDPVKRNFYMISLGDSRAEWNIGHLVGSTCDQKPDITHITNFPAWIDTSDGISRLNGDLAVGSAIGDNTELLTGCIGRTPYKYNVKYRAASLDLILATDGLWDIKGGQAIFGTPITLHQKTDDNVTIIRIKHSFSPKKKK